MATLTGDVKVWSLREDVVVRDADFTAVRYQDKSSVSKERVYYEEKKRFIEARGGCVVLKNSRPSRLRDAIKEFEELLASERVVWSGWQQQQAADISAVDGEEPCRLYQLVLSSGVLCSVCVSAVTGDVRGLSCDKYLTGRLLADHPAHAAVTSSHVLVSYNDARLSVLHVDSYTSPFTLLLRPATAPSPSDVPAGGVPPPLSSRHPCLYSAQLAGPHGRRFQRRLAVSTAGDMVAVWWERTEDEVYPWSPLAADRRDRANILVYSLRCGQLTLLGHARTHLPPLSVAFSAREAGLLLTVEQGFERRGGVTVLSSVYKISSGALHRASVTTIPLEAPVVSHAYSPREDRLLLACNNGVLALHSHAATHLTRAALSPAYVAWLQPGAMVAVANTRGQLQCFDMALSLVRLQLAGEDGTPVRMLDLADYFCHQPTLSGLEWAPAPTVLSGLWGGEGKASTGEYRQLAEQHSSLLLLLHYSKGPLTCLRFSVPHFSLTHPITNFKAEELNVSHDSSNSNSNTYNNNNNNNANVSSSSSSNKSDMLDVTYTTTSASSTSNTSLPLLPPPSSTTSHFCSVTADVLAGEFLRHGQVEEAVQLCSALCWEQDGGAALKCVTAVVNYIIRRGWGRERSTCGSNILSTADVSGVTHSTGSSSGVVQAGGGGNVLQLPHTNASAQMAANSSVHRASGETAVITTPEGVSPPAAAPSSVGLWEGRVLGAAAVLSSGFLSPPALLSVATEQLYGPPVRALVRRLFFKLLRTGCLQSALRLAGDLGDPDCFLRLHGAAQRAGLAALATDAQQRARALQASAASESSFSSCSRSSCSVTSSGSGTTSSGDENDSNECGSDCSCCSSGDEHSSSGSGSSSSGGSCSETCSTCSSESGDSGSEGEEDERPPQRGARQGGDGKESEAPSVGQSTPVATTEDCTMRPARPLYSQQATASPLPVPAPVLPTPPASHTTASTLTFYDPVTAVQDRSGDSLQQQQQLLLPPPGAYVESEAIPSSVDQFVSMHYSDGYKNAGLTEEYSSKFSPRYSTGVSTASMPGNVTATPEVAPYKPASSLTCPDSVAAICSRDGKVTINITRGSSRRRHHHHHNHHQHSVGDAGGNTGSKKELTPVSTVQTIVSSSDAVVKDSEVQPPSRVSDNRPKPHGHHNRTGHHNSHSSSRKVASDAFRNRRSQRNLADSMDAADSAIAAIQSGLTTSSTAAPPSGSRDSSYQHKHTKHVEARSAGPVASSASGRQQGAAPPAGHDKTPARVSHSTRYHEAQMTPKRGCRVADGLVYQDEKYYNEDTIDEELNRSIYQELSTEEEEGGMVKVVHFGVV